MVIERSGLRALSLNLYAQHGNWPRRQSPLRSGLQALQPDVVALQESGHSERL